MICAPLVIIGLCISFVVAYATTPVVRGIAIKRSILSQPGPRRIHAQATPYLGGLALYLAFLVGAVFFVYACGRSNFEIYRQLTGIVVAGTLIVILGLFDDVKNIKRLKEVARVREAIVDFFYGSNHFMSTEALWRKYFNHFTYAARRNR